MKRIPKMPYINNLLRYYRFNMGPVFALRQNGIMQYHDWLKQFGFSVPVMGDYLEFPDDFSDAKLTLFILRWS